MSESITSNRKTQILSIAAKLFKDKGYEATSMRDIANEMGIEAASLYHHIKSKEEILLDICFEMAQKFNDAIKEVNDIYFNAEEKLKMAIKNHVYIMTSNIEKSAVFINEWRSLPEPFFSEYRQLRDEYEKQFRIIIEDGENEDVFEKTDKKFAALTILSAVNWIYQWYSPSGSMSAEQIAEKLSGMLLGGLRKKFVTDINYKP